MTNNVYADEADRLEMGRRASAVRVEWERAGRGWYCYDARTFDGTGLHGEGLTRAAALEDLLEKIDDDHV